MKRCLLLTATLLLITTSALLSQSNVNIDFGNEFCVLYDHDDTRNFYAVNMNLLEGEELRKAFVKKVYFDSHLAATSSPDDTGIWLLTAHTALNSDNILQKLVTFKEEVLAGETETETIVNKD